MKRNTITGVSVDIHNGRVFVAFQRTDNDENSRFGNSYFRYNTPERMTRIYNVQSSVLKRTRNK